MQTVGNAHPTNMSSNKNTDEPSDLTHTSGGHASWIAAAREEAAAFEGGMAPTSSSARGFLPDPRALRPMLGSRYQLGEEIRRGGQGVVYRGTQLGTRREVAIKFTYSRAEDTAARARFEREAQILAQLKHPNIVTIHESGGEGESLYYVMDFIRGEPLDDHLRHQKRSPREVAALFVKICDAVSIAHLRGVIHRDLKPSNIRVDPSGEPHVLDFGLAKISEFDALQAGSDVLTETGQFLGSVPWASPEQVAAKPENLDIRTDVYSIGVMLYQALTGFFPYPINGPAKLVLENICNFEPKPPSAVFKSVDDDISQVVMKCLRKTPDDRYQSAGDIARELRRYLAGEPIDAKRDQTWYMLRKSAQRYRTAALVASILLVAGIGSLAVLLNSYRNEKELRAAAETARTEAVAAGKRESEQRAKAEEAWREEAKQRQLAGENANRAQAVAGFQGQLIQKLDVESMARSLMDGLREQIRQNVGRKAGRADAGNITVENEMATYASLTAEVQPVDVVRRALADHLLNKAAEAAKAQFGDQPLVQAELLLTVGSALHELGLSKDAEAPLKNALELMEQSGPDGYSANRETNKAIVLTHLAGVCNALGRLPESERYHRKALTIMEQLDSVEPYELVTLNNNLAAVLAAKGDIAGSIAILQPNLVRARQLPEEHKDAKADAIYNLGVSLATSGRVADARPLLEEAVALRESIPNLRPYLLAMACGTLGRAYVVLGETVLSEQMLRRALQIATADMGEQHPDVIYFMLNLADSIKDSKAGEARELFERALTRVRAAYDGPHPGIARVCDGYGTFLRQAGELARAEQLQREAVEINTQFFGDPHPYLATAMNNLASTLIAAERPAEAAELLRNVMRQHAQLNSPADSDGVLTVKMNLARCRMRVGDLDDAEDLLKTIETDSAGGEKFTPPKRDRLVAAWVELWETRIAADPTGDFKDRLAAAKVRLAALRASTQPASQ